MPPILEIDQVNKRYASVQAVDTLSLQVAEGEIFALLGPNGAGKTSTVRMLIGVTRPDSGRITYRARTGTDSRVSPAELGYLPEERGLYQERTIIDVLVYLGRLRGLTGTDARQRAMHWLERLNLADRGKEKPGVLSKGNQQKIQLIAAILHSPRFAILDEPFSGLDPINQELLVELIRELRDGGVTILLSAHQMALVERLADRVLLLDRGRTILHGDMAQLRREAGLGNRLLVEFREAVPPHLTALPGIIDVRVEGSQAHLQLAADSDINPILRQLGEGATIAALHSERPGLHEIYLDAVRRHAGPGTAEASS